MNEPTHCWCWNDGITAARKTAPSVRWIREISATVDGERHGVEVNGYHWARVQRITEGHPDAAIDAALEAVYVARWKERSAVAVSDGIVRGFAAHEIPAGTLVSLDKDDNLCRAAFEPINKPKPSALSRIWAILRGRG